MKSTRIGILGGMSYESTIKYYEKILESYYRQIHNYSYPEIVIFSLDFQKVIDLEHRDNKEEYVEYLMEGIKSLENAGATFIIMAANSPHAVYVDLIKLTQVPILSIVKATAEKANKENLKKLLLLGIKFTMQSSFYQDHFENLGMQIIIPKEREQDDINSIIFNELVIGNFKQESKKRLIEIISSYKIDGVILGCTELPLILHQKDFPIKILDTVEIHVEAALKYYFLHN